MATTRVRATPAFWDIWRWVSHCRCRPVKDLSLNWLHSRKALCHPHLIKLILHFRRMRKRLLRGTLTTSSWTAATLTLTTWTRATQSSATGSTRPAVPWSTPAPGQYTRHTAAWRWETEQAQTNCDRHVSAQLYLNHQHLQPLEELWRHPGLLELCGEDHRLLRRPPRHHHR